MHSAATDGDEANPCQQYRARLSRRIGLRSCSIKRRRDIESVQKHTFFHILPRHAVFRGDFCVDGAIDISDHNRTGSLQNNAARTFGTRIQEDSVNIMYCVFLHLLSFSLPPSFPYLERSSEVFPSLLHGLAVSSPVKGSHGNVTCQNAGREKDGRRRRLRSPFFFPDVRHCILLALANVYTFS